MKSKLLISTVVALVICAGTFIAYKAQANNQIIAKVGSKNISVKYIEEKLQQMQQSEQIDKKINLKNLPKEHQQKLIHSIILSDLILEEAQNAKISSTEKFKSKLDFMKQQLAQEIFIHKIADSAVTDKALEQKYQEYKDSLKNEYEVKVSLLNFKEEKEAKENAQKILTVENFDKFIEDAKNNKEMDKFSELDYLTSNKLPKEFSDVTAKHNSNSISNIFKSDFGWHLMKIIDKRKVKLKDPKELKEQFTQEIKMKAIETYLKELEEKKKVSILITSEEGESK